MRLISFLGLRITILIGNRCTRHKEFFEPLHINTSSTFQYFGDLFKREVHDEQTSVLFFVLLYFVIAWLGMLDNGGFFNIEMIVSSVLLPFQSHKLSRKLCRYPVTSSNLRIMDNFRPWWTQINNRTIEKMKKVSNLDETWHEISSTLNL